MSSSESSTLRAESVLRGYHKYKEIWNPQVQDSFEVRIEEGNRHDRYAVAAQVNEEVVGHVPREISKIVYYFLRNNGSVCGTVIGRRKRSTKYMKGLEIPCIYEFKSTMKKTLKVKQLLQAQSVHRETDLEIKIL